MRLKTFLLFLIITSSFCSFAQTRPTFSEIGTKVINDGLATIYIIYVSVSGYNAKDENDFNYIREYVYNNAGLHDGFGNFVHINFYDRVVDLDLTDEKGRFQPPITYHQLAWADIGENTPDHDYKRPVLIETNGVYGYDPNDISTYNTQGVNRNLNDKRDHGWY